MIPSDLKEFLEKFESEAKDIKSNPSIPQTDQSTMAATPAKIKAYLGKLKECIIDSTTANALDTYKALLLVEILQRGVLPTLTFQDEMPKVIDGVVSAAGKALLSEGSLPNPLLAGVSAMAGMLAEKSAKLLAADDGLERIDIQKALTRSKDVGDERYLALLGLGEDRKSNLLLIAQGYFLRAASFQPNSPQMWKKALDVIVLLGEGPGAVEPFEAAYPLENLIRIAEGKGNSKRVSDLSLRLAESWLSPPALAESIFVPKRKQKTVGPDANKSKQALSKSSNASQDTLWYRILAARAEFETEAALVEERAQEKHTAAKNRGTSASIVTCREKAQKEILLNAAGNDDINENANLLRDIVLEKLLGAPDDETRWKQALGLVIQQVQRLHNRAKSISLGGGKSQAWLDVATFLTPIIAKLEETSQHGKEGTPITGILTNFSGDPVMDLLRILVTSSATTMWMLASSQNRKSSELFRSSVFLRDLAAAVVSAEIDKRATPKSKEGVIATTSNQDDKAILPLECAHMTLAATVGVDATSSLIQDETDRIIAVVEKKDRYAPYFGQFGMPFLGLLNAWSGLFQAAWSYTNLTQARAIVRQAKICVEKARNECGRSPSLIESLLLKLGEADCESGIFAGGFSKVALDLYESVMEQSVGLSSDLQRSIVRSHCQAGLARLALAGRTKKDDGRSDADIAEQFSRLSLTDAESLSADDPAVSGIYLYSTETLEATKSFHKSMSRQLVANSLVKASRPQDAEEFLEAALKDAPNDFDAAFALGAFRLREVLYATGGASPQSEKAARTELLKAAKINSTKAGPFALLGLWYEWKADSKRSRGCYSKALLLDPSHPVAGRGILRLSSYSDVETLCQDATNINSPLNGWAWRAIGRRKAMFEGDDNLAVICFQESLRCIDVSSPHNEVLSAFFDLPGNQPVVFELSYVWAELACSYRRLGRYTAAIRAFDAAWMASGCNLPAQSLCEWAQGKTIDYMLVFRSPLVLTFFSRVGTWFSR